MNTAQILQIEAGNLQATLDLATKIGSRLKGGEVIELVSDLGGGKTTFVKGLAKGIGFTGTVTSPSFTLVNEYKSKDLTLYHMDFYRLSDAGIMSDELAEILTDPKAVVAVEWANIVEDILPADHLRVQITATGEDGRSFKITLPTDLEYLNYTNA